MTMLNVYDAATILAKEASLRRRKKSLQEKLNEFLMSMSYKQILLRLVVDKNEDNFGGLENFLRNCLQQGHDRWAPDNYGHISKRWAISKWYQGNDLFFAVSSADNNSKPFVWPIEYNPKNFGILVVDGRNYKDEDGYVYAQKDVQKRKDALVGILLFDVKNLTNIPRAEFQCQVNEANVAEIVGQIHSLGYFLIR